MVSEIQVWDGDGTPRPERLLGSWGFKWQVSAEVAQEIVVAVQVTVGGHPIITVPVDDFRFRGKPDELQDHVIDICDRILRGLSLDAQTAFREAIRTFLGEDPL